MGIFNELGHKSQLVQETRNQVKDLMLFNEKL